MQSMLDPLSKSLAIAFLLCMTLSLGLEISWPALKGLLRHWRMLCRVLAANLILVPLLGLALVTLLPMPSDFAIAFLLLAAAPGAPMSLRYTRGCDNDAPFAAALLSILSLAAICFTPLIAEMMLPVQARLEVPYGQLAVTALLYMSIPALIGIAFQYWRGGVTRMRRVSLILARVFFLIWTVVVTAEQSRAVKQLGFSTLAAMVLLVLGSMVIGWFLGGPRREFRRILATGTSMRNVALCAVIAMKSFPHTRVDIALVAFSALMVTPNSLLLLYETYRSKQNKVATAAT